uniref:Uncharacterized protein LOC104221257 n=1 Tax=Nicotiana sylvestris TaxID=4096 RepID=A0A1U7VW29_NICSY|nr:PREDICTED: uncharacterized protein LOC104221257 [Nicotiana sylvestris]
MVDGRILSLELQLNLLIFCHNRTCDWVLQVRSRRSDICHRTSGIGQEQQGPQMREIYLRSGTASANGESQVRKQAGLVIVADVTIALQKRDRRPDIAHAIGTVSGFLSNRGKKYWDAVRWILRYLKGTADLKLCFGNGKPEFVCYTDSNLGGNLGNSRSTSGYLITFTGEVMSWQSRL